MKNRGIKIILKFRGTEHENVNWKKRSQNKVYCLFISVFNDAVITAYYDYGEN